MDISIVTLTMGREKYLLDCIDSVFNDLDRCDSIIDYEHHVVFQGIKPSKITKNRINNNFCILHEWPENAGIGEGLNRIMPELKGNLILKLDEDAKIISQNFFEQALAIHKRFPDAIWSPYPVGLISNGGGPKGYKHDVWWNKDNDIYYTRRHVQHVGGFARFSPAKLSKNFIFQNDLIKGVSGDEDGQFSSYCNRNNIPMFYLENGLVVEHNSSTLGQIARFPEYFKDRVGEQRMKFEVIE
jgi:glycosyltransferase involved in cell wall biosynthesis